MAQAITGKHCCETMTYWANYKCTEHQDIFACPDNIIYFSARPLAFGIIVHDGGSSYINIDHCPWCGSSLKKKKEK